MPRLRPEPSREALEVDWAFFGELCRALALRVARDYDPDVVVGIAKAGVIPAAIIATILQRDFAAISIGRAGAGAAPEVLSEPPAISRRMVKPSPSDPASDLGKLNL